MIGWRKPKGRDNKMRESRKGKPPLVSIGYRKQNENRKTIIVHNTKDLQNAKKGVFVILGRVGGRKRTEIAKRAHELGISFKNLNIKKLLEKNEPG